MTIPKDATSELDPPPASVPRTEDEFLKQESRHARQALSRLRGEIVEALGNTADVSAWTARYPWQSLAAAITAGLTAGVAMGAATRKKPPASEADRSSPEAPGPDAAAAGSNGQPHPGAAAEPAPPDSAKLVGGLATLMGILGSTVTAAATQAIAQVVKESIHDALKPEPNRPASTNGEPVEPVRP